MTALSVNVNKFALIRNARGADMPNLVDISKKCIESVSYTHLTLPTSDLV